MRSDVVSFFKPAPRSRDWENQELAEFYRVEASLIRSGVSIETDRGLSDEGDPWFVFCRTDTGDVIIHFARVDGYYVVASPAFDSCVRGREFRPLIESLIESHPLIIPKAKDGGRLFIHPAALLVALVATCFFKLGQTDAVAAELKATHPVAAAAGSPVQKELRGNTQAVALDERETAVLIGAIAAAAAWSSPSVAAAAPFSSQLALGHEVLDQGVAPSVASLGEGSPGGLQSAQHLSAVSSSGSQLDGFYADAPQFTRLASIVRSSEALNAPPILAQKVIVSDDTIIWTHDEQASSASAFPGHVGNLVSAFGQAGQVAVANASLDSGAFSTNSYAGHEVGAAVGSSLFAHLVTDYTGPEQQLILHEALKQSIGSAGSSQASVTAPSHVTAASSEGVNSSMNDTSGSASSAAASSGQTSSSGSWTSMSAADIVIREFIAEHSDYQMMTLKNEVILYDPHLSASNISTAVEETLSFSDGSSVFLIGLPAQTHSVLPVS